MIIELEPLLHSIVSLAKQAGREILKIYRQMDNKILQVKKDGSPFTQADQVANDIIVAGLSRLSPKLPILSEEGTDVPFAQRVGWNDYWLVDPLDGTKEFIHHTDEFTVNIALIEKHRVLLGVVYVPVLDECYFAGRHLGAFKQTNEQKSRPIHVKLWQGGKVRVIASRRHGVDTLKPFLEKLEKYEVTYGGSSLKFCRVAEGVADIYPRLATTSEWDTAAAQCVVEQAGGAVMDMHGLPLQYNMSDSLQNPHFIVVGDTQHNWLQYLKY